jgi:Na+/H+ antiporter NhaC
MRKWSFLIILLSTLISPLQSQIQFRNWNPILLPSSSVHLEVSDTLKSQYLYIRISNNIRQVLDSMRIQDHLVEYQLRHIPSGSYTISVLSPSKKEIESKSCKIIPGWVSLVPPILAIFLALATRQVLIALFLGIFSGAFIIYDYNLFKAFARMLDTILIQSINSPEKISIILFSLVLGGVVGIISKNGGTYGIVDSIRKIATNRKRGQLATFLMGVFIFFDDYANTLIVGNTMRPLTDKLKISREKLAYLIDSTAAPIANIAIISTWIGYELSILTDNLHKVGLDYNPYIFFIKSIIFNFYPLFSIIFIVILILQNRDFGSMYKAEKRASESGQLLAPGAMPLSNFADPALEPVKGTPFKWYNGLIPILTIILVTVFGLYISGLEQVDSRLLAPGIGVVRRISFIIGNSNSFNVLLWASFSGTVVAILLSLGQRIMNLHETMEAWVSGIKAMVPAALILTSAWAIGAICSEVRTAEYVVHLSQKHVSVYFLPTIIFISASLISFSTGTSWGTMAILLPITIPLAHELALVHQLDPSHHYSILLISFTSVLAGATFGDHCSPISDTTIMSSMAAGSDHIDHVRTQLPYSITVAFISILFGYIPAGFNISPAFSLLGGGIFIFFFLRKFGKKIH